MIIKEKYRMMDFMISQKTIWASKIHKRKGICCLVTYWIFCISLLIWYRAKLATNAQKHQTVWWFMEIGHCQNHSCSDLCLCRLLKFYKAYCWILSTTKKIFFFKKPSKDKFQTYLKDIRLSSKLCIYCQSLSK